VFYQQIEHKWSREEYIEFCSRNERHGLVWIKAGVWKLRGIKRGLGKGTCPLCMEIEDVKRILLSCTETKKNAECNLRVKCGYV
jgi:hypothetical protein